MTSTLELIERTRQSFLLTGAREERNRLDGAITDAVEAVTVEFDRRLAPDFKLSVGLEDMIVWDVTGQVATVERGALGSTAAAATDKATVLINSWCSPAAVLQALQTAVVELDGHAGLYKVGATDLSLDAASSQLDLGDIDVDAILDVFVKRDFDDSEWDRVMHWSLLRDTGPNPVLDLSRTTSISRTVRVAYRQPLGEIDAATADVEATTGITNPNLLAVTAAISLSAGRPVRRTALDAQPSSRRANEVAPFSTDNATRALERHQKRLLDAERMKLMQRYPIRRNVT